MHIEHRIARVVAGIYYGMLLSGESVEPLLLAASASDSNFEIDRGDNPPAEDFNVLKSQQLYEAYQKISSSAIAVAEQLTGMKRLNWQSPYLVRYSEDRRSELDLHADNSRLTFVLYLNDNFKGGELDFPTLGVRLQPKAGFLAIFPGGKLYPHRSLKVIGGTKYALVTMASATIDMVVR